MTNVQEKVRFKESAKILWYFLMPYKRGMATVLLATIVAGIFETLNLAAIYPIVNYGLKIEPKGKVLTAIDSMVKYFGQDNMFFSSCVFLIVITIFAAASKIVFHYLSSQLSMKIVSENQQNIFKKYLGADYKYFVKSQQGKLIYAGTVAPIGVSNSIIHVSRLASSLVTCLFFIAFMSILVWQGTLLIMVLGVAYVLFIKRILEKIVGKYSHLSVREEQKKNVILNEFITGVKSVKAYHNFDYWKTKYVEAVKRSALFMFRIMVGRAIPFCFLKFIFFISFALIGMGISKYYAGDMVALLPLLATFIAVASRLVPYANLTGSDVVTISRYMPDTKIVYDILNANLCELKTGTKTIKGFNRAVTYRDVWFKYEGAEDFVLKGVTLSIPKEKVTAIVGPSGSGKSTIISLLLKLYCPETGAIEIDNVNIFDLSNESYLSKMGYVSQETFIFNGTIEGNIRFGNEDATQAEIIEAAQLANAHEFILDSENGYATIVGDAGIKLSGGQRQRIAIARAMLRRPEIIVLDEATSSLDNISEKKVQEAINRISKHTTVLVVAHRLSTVMNADRIIVLEEGRIVESGTHDDLLKEEKAYFSLYNT